MHGDDTSIPQDIGALAVAMLPPGSRILARRDGQPVVATVTGKDYHRRGGLYSLELRDDAGHVWRASYRGMDSPRLISWPDGWDDAAATRAERP